MVQQEGCSVMQCFKKEDLSSYEYKKILCKNDEIKTLEALTSNVSDYYDCEGPFNNFNTKFKSNHDDLKTKCNQNGPKCCRDVNYYLDFATGIFKSSMLENDDKNKLIKRLKDELEVSLRENDIYVCERKTDIDSTRKRCILQHLHDSKEDEKSILSFPEKYKDHLSEKWKKIISYTDSQVSSIFVKIENNSMGIVENYAKFLHSSDYICGNDLDELSYDDIKISTNMNDFLTSISLDKISLNVEKNLCFNKRYVDMLKYKASNLQRINNVLSIGIALLGFFLILVFLHEFSPLGSLLRRFTKKKIEVDENANDEILDSYENSENERPYISYHSTSH
ncbi:PIR Superfamily Protein [Plasmodium ovale wallikeri]|uniref:PIR Superfamily Protein n=1 Tax=Plasmodium ovale wallikeri TaxID=864142 RepID=A0A1A9APD1_PLAOA|nr:PIR Superfamily Protein [Plasmodium ovale wallikeri]SBT58086.1 PIR Superfamily Protein [Plasmodium ovale wallikeri]